MLNKEEFSKIQEDLKNKDLEREEVILLSRDIIRESKMIIYGLHRGDEVSLDKMRELFSKLGRNCKIGIANTAAQEYVEALTYYYFVNEKRIPNREELKVNSEEYLLGLCDLAGELVRKAVKDSIKKNFDSVLEIRDFVEELYGEFLKFNLRNGELRKKSDSVRWNLNKLEELALDVSKRK